ncbi:MAG: threonine--tRNA ligase [Proteobacteria bacterium]|nr:threonine--tRNA ligase [Cystobacterineae bacterium]MCL2259082.1 threonine--tRNA ligase [Cystobacterineae bacterium]MCL2314359.1 threonine--tRNA ligase [Pseudomonadota bacterium]
MVAVTLLDGSQKHIARGASIFEFIQTHIGPGLAKAAVFARYNGKDVDLSFKLEEDGQLGVFTDKTPEALEVARHDAAHIVADAVQRLFPGTQVTLGPPIEEGFYYDFFRDRPFSLEELEQIEAKANEIVAEKQPFTCQQVSAEEALALFESKKETFKLEIIRDIVAKGAKELTLYRHGEWVDFCLGPHGPSTAKVGVIKILNASGAYWRGDSSKPMLQRIYGTSFFEKKALEAWLKQQEEAKRRDHRKLGKELDLFHFHATAPGAAFWSAKGTTLYNTLSHFMRKLVREAGYVEVKTPLLFHKSLWEQSGHWGKYRENMFLVMDDETGEHSLSLKPMNCPSHHLFFGFKRRSYRELPMRLWTQDVLHRNEPTGALGGLTRVRQFCQDDAHIYLAPSQLVSEVKGFVQLLDKAYRAFGLSYEAKFATRPAQRLGDEGMWDKAEGGLRDALEGLGLSYTLKEGDGAFYGPKLDFDVSDAIGRKWQLGTLQLDYAAAERFDLSFVGEDNSEHRPVVLHRAVFGSFERFVAILIEHYAGAFPLWLAPVQAVFVTVADRHLPYAHSLCEKLVAEGFRAEVDERSMTLNAKIRDAQMQKIPLALVVGDKEAQSHSVSPRRHGGEDLKSMGFENFMLLLREEARIPW